MRRVPFVGDEKAQLYTALDRHRDLVPWKLEGLTDEQLRRPLVPSGSTMLGLVKHLAAVDVGWFAQTFGRETEPLPFDDGDPEADFRVGADESAADILAFYARARLASDAVIHELDLEAEGTAWFGDTVNLRWVLIHMIEETCRHLGHLDILRELVDGTTGDFPDHDQPE
jgi:uncharacterized damage-inducible protein DinB